MAGVLKPLHVPKMPLAEPPPRELSRVPWVPRGKQLGIEVAQSTVAKYMARGGRGRSQT